MCDEVLLNSKDLNAHVTSKHPESAEAGEINECEHCGKQFRSAAVYQNHLRKHSKDENLECQICNKRYLYYITVLVIYVCRSVRLIREHDKSENIVK